jgi:hypothetical protein
MGTLLPAMLAIAASLTSMALLAVRIEQPAAGAIPPMYGREFEPANGTNQEAQSEFEWVVAV